MKNNIRVSKIIIILSIIFSCHLKSQITLAGLNEGQNIAAVVGLSTTNFEICSGAVPSVYTSITTGMIILTVDGVSYPITSVYHNGGSPYNVFFQLPPSVILTSTSIVSVTYNGCGTSISTPTINPKPVYFTLSPTPFSCTGPSTLTPSFKEWISVFNLNSTPQSTNIFKLEIDGVNADISNFTNINGTYTSAAGIFQYTATPGSHGAIESIAPKAMTTNVKMTQFTDNYAALTVGYVSLIYSSLTDGNPRQYRYVDGINGVTETVITGAPFLSNPGDVLEINSLYDKYELKVNGITFTVIPKTITLTTLPISSSGTVIPSTLFPNDNALWTLPPVNGTYSVLATMGGLQYINTYTINSYPVVTSSSVTSVCSGDNFSYSILSSVGSTYSWLANNNLSVLGESLTTQTTSIITNTLINTSTIPQLVIYTITPTSLTGCLGLPYTVSVTVNPKPTIIISALSTTLCSGSSTSLSASGAATYTWLPSSAIASTISVSPTTTTTYSVNGVNSFGCINNQSVSLIVSPLPIIGIIPGISSICLGDAVNLSVLGAFTSYTWSTGANTSNISVSPTVSTVYSVTATSAIGCTTSATSIVNVKPIPTITLTASSSSVCIGNSVNLSATGASSYSWNPIGIVGSSISDSPTASIIYTVIGTSTLGCSNSQTISILVNPLPNVLISTISNTMCSGTSATLNASGALSYTWLPSGLSSPSIIVSPMVATTYTVNGINSFGCVNTQTILLTVNPTPFIGIIPGISSICLGENATLSILGAFTSYTWSNGANTSNITVSPILSSIYTVTATSSFGCVNSSSATINVKPVPTVTASISSSSICAGNSVTLTASGADSYNWLPLGISGSSISHSPTTSTTYTVVGTNTLGCSSSQTISVLVNPVPNVAILAVSNSLCIGSPITFTASGASTYTWMPSTINTQTLTDTPLITTTYTLIGESLSGCVNSNTLQVLVNPMPTGTFSVNLNSGCQPLEVNFIATSIGTGDVYEWEFINPNIVTGNNLSYTYFNAGIFDVKLTIINSFGCKIDIIKPNYITVYPKPIASFYAVPPTTSILEPNISFINTSTLATSYLWDFGDPTSGLLNQSTDTNSEHFYENSETYVVNLVATSINGCMDTASLAVNITPEFAIYIPNTFSPNDDNINNTFNVFGIGIDEENYKMDIYNKWGQKIYYSNNFRMGWTGKDTNENLCKQDVYTYKIEIIDYAKRKHLYVGHVTLIK